MWSYYRQITKRVIPRYFKSNYQRHNRTNIFYHFYHKSFWRLEDEIGELEKRYQDQRKRLLAEVHVERESMERANEATLAIKEKENERKWQAKSLDMQKKIESIQIQHQVRPTILI